jgi:hypothetical protein
MNKLSWKTTVAGILLGIGTPLASGGDGIYKTIGIALATLGSLLMGFSARDNKVTSEDVGAHLK